MLLLGGIYLTFKGNFFQFTKFFKSLKLVKKAFSSPRSGEINSFGAACTALSATVGTGNIAGVAGAISIGGAGAVFWMWLSALAGMCIKAIEIILSVKFREQDGISFKGGPIYYIKNGLSKKFKPLAFLFAIASIPAVFCSGNITQTNAAVMSITENKTTQAIIGVIFSVLTLAVIMGGVKRIGIITEKIVPIMSALYIIICTVLIIFNIDFLPIAFKMILKGAFSPKAVTCGTVASVLTTIIVGAQRGVFSNEAGLGTSGMAHSVASDANPETQGLFGIFEVFIDTILICTLTALTILCSKVPINYGSAASSELVVRALSVTFGKLASPLISIMLCLFAFSSIIGWAVYGSISSEFLFGRKAKTLFLWLYPSGSLIGAIANVDTAWNLSAFFNGIMMIINIPIVIMLSDSALKHLKSKKTRIKYVGKKNRKNKGNFRK